MSNQKEIYILGVGHNTLNIVDLALDCGYKIGGLIHYNDERTGEIYHGFNIIGSFSQCLVPDFVTGNIFALSMGDLKIKDELFHTIKKMGGFLPSLLHPTSVISRFAEIGEGVLVQSLCLVEASCRIRNNSTIVAGSIIHHNTEIGYDNLISGNVVMGAYCTTGEKVHIGQGATVVSGKVEYIGDNSILGAGAVLLNNMEANSIYVGNPARLLRKR